MLTFGSDDMVACGGKEAWSVPIHGYADIEAEGTGRLSTSKSQTASNWRLRGEVLHPRTRCAKPGLGSRSREGHAALGDLNSDVIKLVPITRDIIISGITII